MRPLSRLLRAPVIVAAAALLVLSALAGLFLVRHALEDLPSMDALADYVPPLVTRIVDTNNKTIGELFTERRTTIPLSQIPLDLRRAVMAIEDTDFHEHWGINIKAIVRAAVANFRAGRLVQGGSTLTQQLTKTIFLSRQRTFDRKFKELLLTIQIEHRYSKDEIMELYLNQVYFGGGAYGVEAAAKLYFGKRAQEMTLPECALLAGLIRSPNRYSPLADPERARDRRATVLRRMEDLNAISAKERAEADASPVAPPPAGVKSKEAPYFIEEIRKQLEPVYGAENLEQDGYTIKTTLDIDMQRAAEAALDRHLKQYDVLYGTATLAEYNKELLKNAEDKNAVKLSTSPPRIQGAVVILDVRTGGVRAMIGGADFATSQFNRAMQAKRQPGSSFKPFLYAAALEGSFTPATQVDDNPVVFTDMESDPTLLAQTTSYALTDQVIYDNLGVTKEEFLRKKKKERDELLKRFWRPQNYDGKYQGVMTFRSALQRSRNLVSIRIIDSIGPRTAVRMAQSAGITSRLDAVLSLALGTSVVNLLELVNAYGTFAAGGLHAEPYFLERVTDRDNRVLQENTPKIQSRVKPQTAFLITNLLKGVVQRGTGGYAMRTGRTVGGKTGTTQDQRDMLFIGFSPDVVCGVWVGYDDFRPLKKGLTASHIAVPLWTDIMTEVLKNAPDKDFPVPPGIEFAKIDADTGYLALPSCPKVLLEGFRAGTVPTDFCPVDHVNRPAEEEKETVE